MSTIAWGQRKDAIIAACVAVTASFVLFGNGMSGPFILDDTIVITGNPLVDGDPGDVIRAFEEPYHFNQPRTGIYRPLTIASYALNRFVFGPGPGSFHAVNILLHALAAWMLFRVLLFLGTRRLAYAAMGIFLVLPIHVEAVTSIVGRAELIATVGALTAFYYALRERYLFSSLALLAGILGKETAVAVLPVILFAELFRKKPSWKILATRMAWFAPTLVLYGALRFAALGKQYFLSNDATIVYNPIKFAGFFPGLWTSFKVLALYLQKTFLPLGFSSDYSFNQIPIVAYPWQSAASVIGVAVVLVMAVLAVRYRSHILGLGAFLFLASYFVISNWVFKIGTVMGERLMYLPSVALAVLVAWLAMKAWDRFGPRPVQAAGGIILLFFAYQTVQANRLWLDERTLFENAYRQSPMSVVSMTNKAYLHLIDSELESADRVISDALELAPEHAPALNLAGHVAKRQGNLQEAESLWKRAIASRPDYLRAYLSLGMLYYENGYLSSAEGVLSDAIAIYPRWNEVLFLSLTKVAMGKHDEAIALVTRHFGDNPQEKGLQFVLGAAYLKKGEQATAETYLRRVTPPHLSFTEFVKTVAEGKVFNLGDSIQ